MGAGGRIDPTRIAYADISETFHCSLAKAVRKRLKDAGIKKGLKVVFSSEQPDRMRSSGQMKREIKNPPSEQFLTFRLSLDVI